MQITRHWRMNPIRYRLEGVKYPNGEVSLQPRPAAPEPKSESKEVRVGPSPERRG